MELEAVRTADGPCGLENGSAVELEAVRTATGPCGLENRSTVALAGIRGQIVRSRSRFLSTECCQSARIARIAAISASGWSSGMW